MATNNATNFPKVRTVVANSTQQMENNVCYMINATGLHTLTLPATSEMGDVVHFCTMVASNSFHIAQHADQYMVAASSGAEHKTTIGTGGYVSGGGSSYYTYYSLMCIEANKGWIFTGYQSAYDSTHNYPPGGLGFY